MLGTVTTIYTEYEFSIISITIDQYDNLYILTDQFSINKISNVTGKEKSKKFLLIFQ